MLTLQTGPASETQIRTLPEKSIEAILGRLASSMTRAAAETAGAFFSAKTAVGPTWESPRIKDLGALRCSQKNMGEKFEMVCNLAVEKGDWDTLFTADENDQFKMDAFCEMANCICGTVLADPSFTDEFGYLIPCVPCSGYSRAVSGSRTLRGAFRLSGILIHFSFTVQEVAVAIPQDRSLTAAA